MYLDLKTLKNLRTIILEKIPICIVSSTAPFRPTLDILAVLEYNAQLVVKSKKQFLQGGF